MKQYSNSIIVLWPILEDSKRINETKELNLKRPCPCGCDNRMGSLGVGYLIGRPKNSIGFTIWLDSEEVYQAIRLSLLESGINERNLDL